MKFMKQASSSLINFILNDHECKIHFIYMTFQVDFINFNLVDIFSMKIDIVVTSVVNYITYSRKIFNTCVVITCCIT